MPRVKLRVLPIFKARSCSPMAPQTSENNKEPSQVEAIRAAINKSLDELLE
jgi:hypothetical protein